MKKRNVLGTTALAGVLLFTGVGHQAHAAEKKIPVYVFTEKEFNENRTGQTEGFGGGPGSDVSVVIGDESYQEYLARVKAGEKLSESLAPIEYIYPDEAQSNGQVNNKETQSPAQSNVAPQQTDNPPVNNQVGTQGDTQATTQAPEQSTVQQLPQTGEQQTTTTWMTLAASVLLAVGSLLTFKRFAKNTK
ncbi:LPXTG cell wall anchor domain-containing protein [Staphylococcus simiae]|uniref:Gram-positive cocci surface proteins LPxTG domain-containing protein n=1 Tax=Staphylococcus simiae CCM 7213 = CCUG 51256 TaxID=911238 RepID=G5JL95_9STAP|nr:LPXTG cell wall anchor domain-containing protein [Staphylococcus simiae]EHJ07033.1 hypothetical protein SS7213T_11310 [Staphylococcus simiae CCM 7213 = CCUG 51256]PNZ14017.1 cell wall protein [Staphylococcus simiae]SNV80351.1 LPXTG-motif surface-anchored protein [Staphylococcus simiae]